MTPDESLTITSGGTIYFDGEMIPAPPGTYTLSAIMAMRQELWDNRIPNVSTTYTYIPEPVMPQPPKPSRGNPVQWPPCRKLDLD